LYVKYILEAKPFC